MLVSFACNGRWSMGYWGHMADLFVVTRVIVRRDDYDGEIYSSLET